MRAKKLLSVFYSDLNNCVPAITGPFGVWFGVCLIGSKYMRVKKCIEMCVMLFKN